MAIRCVCCPSGKGSDLGDYFFNLFHLSGHSQSADLDLFWTRETYEVEVLPCRYEVFGVLVEFATGSEAKSFPGCRVQRTSQNRDGGLEAGTSDSWQDAHFRQNRQ